MSKHPPLCINCKHHSIRPDLPAASDPLASDYTCNAMLNLVTGKRLTWKCEYARGDQLICGRDGKLFEPIQP